MSSLVGVPRIVANTVSAIGDSITAANGNYPGFAITSSTGVGAYLGWASVLPKTGATMGDGRLRPHVTSATGGYNVSQIKTTHLPVILALSPLPAFCVVLAGTNDVLAMTSQSAIDTRLSDVASMYDALRAAGVTPVACSIPAYDNATPQSAIATYNAGIEALATARGIPYADFHTATADPSTGYYLPGMRLDGVHPTGTGGKAMGQVLRDALESHLPATTPTLVTSATEASGWLWQNGAMLRDSNSDGTPNGGGTESATAWGRTSGAADASFSLVAESGVVSGNWMRVNKTANTATTTLLGNGISVSDNHLIGYGALIKATLSSGAAVTLQWYKSSNTSQREYGITLQGYVGDIAPFVWYLEKTVPASTSQVRPNLSISGGTADVYLGQLTVRDLG